MAEVNDAMMGRLSRERSVRKMSSGRTQHHIEYADGREVRMTLVDAPALVETDGEGRRIVTVKDKRYVVDAAPHTDTCLEYWTERDGKAFGATRFASASRKPGTVGRAIWDAVSQRTATTSRDYR